MGDLGDLGNINLVKSGGGGLRGEVINLRGWRSWMNIYLVEGGGGAMMTILCNVDICSTTEVLTNCGSTFWFGDLATRHFASAV